MKGEEHFIKRWEGFKKQVNKIKKLTNCTKKFITVHESFFTEVKERRWEYKLFTPVTKSFFSKKLTEMKAMTDENTILSINQIIMS